MNIAFLFNSDHPSLGGYYGPPVMDRILATKVLQNTKQHMRVSFGDILTYMAARQSKTPTMDFLIELCRQVYKPGLFSHLIIDRLEATHGKATVYCWLFQNMTVPIARALHKKLKTYQAYLGAMDVEFADPIQLHFFRNSLIEAYRLYGKSASIFYMMSENEDPDILIKEYFEKNGYSVKYEDMGARHTIFDNYNLIDHFKRIEDFKQIFSKFEQLNDDNISSIIYYLEELHPKLFDAFSSAARTLQRAETEEDYAQAALSGRRLLIKLADYLFPPRKDKYNGRNVGREQYKNRLWAYIEQTINEYGGNKNTSLHLGKETDRLVDLFNAGLHADPTKSKVETAFTDLIVWLSHVIELAPEAARKPYLAYEDELIKFVKNAE